MKTIVIAVTLAIASILGLSTESSACPPQGIAQQQLQQNYSYAAPAQTIQLEIVNPANNAINYKVVPQAQIQLQRIERIVQPQQVTYQGVPQQIQQLPQLNMQQYMMNPGVQQLQILPQQQQLNYSYTPQAVQQQQLRGGNVNHVQRQVIRHSSGNGGGNRQGRLRRALNELRTPNGNRSRSVQKQVIRGGGVSSQQLLQQGAY